MNREAVYVVENGKIEKRIIKTGYEMTNSVEVTSGLLEERCSNPDDGLSEGDRVAVIE